MTLTNVTNDVNCPLNRMHRGHCRLTQCGEAIQFVAVFFCAMDAMNAGMEYGWTSASFPVLLKPRNNESEPFISSHQGVWIATLPLPGAMLGALTNGFVCDRVGRKPFLMFTTIPYAIGWILISIANAAYFYYISRLMTGFSSGMALSAIPMYVGEISNPRFRGRLCAVTPMCIVTGVFLINFIRLFLTIEATALVMLAFPLTSFLGLFFMPDSSYYYLMKNKEDKAVRSLQIFGGKEDVQEDLQRMKQAVQEHSERKEGGFKALVSIKVNRRSLCIVIVLRALQPVCGISTLVYYSSVILEADESSLPVRYSTLIFAISLMVSVFIGLNAVDWLGRRPLMLFSLTGSCLGLTSLAIYTHLKVSDVDVSSYSAIPIVALVVTVAFFGVGLQHVPYVLQGEIFPTSVKAPAVGIGLISFCLFSFIGSKYFQIMNDLGKSYITIYTFAIFAVLSFLFVLFLMPETKDLSLEDVQLMMEQKKIHFKDVKQSAINS